MRQPYNGDDMRNIRADNAEDRRQLDLLRLPLGMPGSGMHRYGAAMYFYQTGNLDVEQLEAYRICCNLDSDDPVLVAQSRRTLNITG